MTRRLVVITGGPGAGKTTLVAALAAAGFATVPESGRAVIRAEVAAGGTAIPSADREAFAARMLAADVAAYVQAAQGDAIVIFDRGIPDTIGYLELCGLPTPRAAWDAARTWRYENRVLVAPPWRAIFVNDPERTQTFSDAEATYRIMLEVYAHLGYATVALPHAPVGDRVAFVRGLLA